MFQPSDANFPPEYVDFVKIYDAEINATPAIPADASAVDQKYMWRIDTYLHGDPAIEGLYEDIVILGDPLHSDPNFWDDEIIPALYSVDQGPLMYFTAANDFPVESVVIETPPTYSWINKIISLEATITDDGVTASNVVWTVTDRNMDGEAVLLSDPNVIFSSESYVDNGDGTLTAKIDMKVNYHAAQVDVDITANDESGLGAATAAVIHDITNSACQVTYILGLDETHSADIDGDCIVGLGDVAALAADWVSKYAIEVPTVIPVAVP
jgi:hypothetical protein